MAGSRRKNRRLARRPGTLAQSVLATLTRIFETLICGLFRDRVQFCSGQVDLVVCVGRHGGGAHRLARAGERFVGLIAEEIADMSC